MSFDARSRERLEALGRTLPQPLPKPAAIPSPKASQRRHRVEVEQNPEALFRVLMQVSPDGSVPPHLMERLKQLEGRRPEPAPTRTKRQGQGPLGRPDASRAAEHDDLYTAFQQLLLEDDSPG